MFHKALLFVLPSAVAGTGLHYLGSSIPSAETYLFRSFDLTDNTSQTSKKDGKTETVYSLDALKSKGFYELPIVKVPFTSILRGTKEYSDGNYLLYLGSITCSHCTDLMYGNTKPSEGFYDSKFHSFSSGGWASAVKYGSEFTKGKVKFILFEDKPTTEDLSRDGDLWMLPWLTYQATNKSKGEIKGEYKRYDRSAVDFRKIFDYGRTIYPNEVKGTPTIIAYKNGVPSFHTGANTGTGASTLKEFIRMKYHEFRDETVVALLEKEEEKQKQKTQSST